jgi:hypothetical protein
MAEVRKDEAKPCIFVFNRLIVSASQFDAYTPIKLPSEKLEKGFCQFIVTANRAEKH